jgi:hypothetical protein
MSKSNTFETDFLRLIFNNTGISLVGDATGLPGSATAGSLFVSLHTADPGEAGDQSTSETTYTGYARVGVARSGANWVVTNNSVSPNAAITFGACTAGTATITHFGVGASSSGAGKLLYKGAISPTISVSSGVTPQLTTATAITED